MSSTTPLADRYGAPTPGRRRAVVAAVIGTAVLSGSWLAWTAWDHSTPEVESELVSFQVVDQHTATAVMAMRFRSEAVQARCLLRAYAEDHTVVGELSFVPAQAVDGTVEQTVRTERRATSIETIGCTADGQPRPR